MKTTFLLGAAYLLLAAPLTCRAQTGGGVPIGTAGAPDAPAVSDRIPNATAAPIAALAYPSQPAAGQRPTLGGPPQIAPPPAVDTTGLGAAALLMARLQQLRLPDNLLAGQAAPAAGGAAISVQEVARVFPQAVRRQPGFLPDVAAPATATAGSRSLLVLALPSSAAGVPGGGAAVGQRLLLRGAASEVVVTVARPAAVGSCTLVVRGTPELAGQPVFVVGLEHPVVQAIDYEILALLSMKATQELARQLAAGQQQLAGLRDQLAAARRLNSALLLDHAALQDLQQQLSHLQAQQAAAFSVTQRRVSTGWAAD